MPIVPPPNVPPNLSTNVASAIVRQVEKQNQTPRDHGKAEREAEAKRQRNSPNRYGTNQR